MPFHMEIFAKMYIADKTTINCALDFTEMNFVCSVYFSPRRRHSGTFMIFEPYARVIRSNKDWINLLLIFYAQCNHQSTAFLTEF